jgi:ABC transporter substrate binding protein
LTPIDARDDGGIEQTIAGFTRESSCGLIVTASPSAFRRRELIVALAARHRLPAVYSVRAFVADGGLISYGPDEIDQYRQAAGYIDRILKGEKPANLPVQAPNQTQSCHKFKDRQGARPRSPGDCARPRRRGDRIKVFSAAVH